VIWFSYGKVLSQAHRAVSLPGRFDLRLQRGPRLVPGCAPLARVSRVLARGHGHGGARDRGAMAAEIPGSHRVTLGADRGYDTRETVRDLRTPHVAQNVTGRSSRIDGRTTRHPGYAVSQRRRKRVEEVFEWMKTVGLMRKTRHRGTARVGWMFVFTAAAYDLARIRNLGYAT